MNNADFLKYFIDLNYNNIILPVLMNAILQSTHLAKPSRKSASAMLPFGYKIEPTKLVLLTDSKTILTLRCNNLDSTK